MKNIKGIVKHLEAKEYDLFGDDLYNELQLFPQGYESIDEMVQDQGAFNMARFLCEDFPDRYEF